MMILYYIYQHSSVGRSFIEQGGNEVFSEITIKLLKLFAEMKARDYTKAKRLWIFEVCKLSQMSEEVYNCIVNDKEGTMDFFGSEEERGVRFVLPWFNIKKVYNCSNSSCRIPKIEIVNTFSDFMCSSSSSFAFTFNNTTSMNCDRCKKTSAKTSYGFIDDKPPSILALSIVDRDSSFNDEQLHTKMKLKGVNYNLFAYTIILRPRCSIAHIVTVFVTPGGKLLYDGMIDKLSSYRKQPENSIVNTVWLVKAE
jgi:hypothetical protein